MNVTDMDALMAEWEALMQEPMYQTIFWVTVAVTLVISLAISVVMYILQGIGVRQLCRTAHIAHPAYAFVPVLRWMQLGRLAELRLPQEPRAKKPFAYSVHLPIVLTLRVLLNVVYSAYTVVVFAMPETPIPAQVDQLMGGVSMAFSVIDLIAVVMLLLALYRVFARVGCGSPMLFTILSGLVTVCLPIFLFVFRKNAVAMPAPDADDGSDDFYTDGK